MRDAAMSWGEWNPVSLREMGKTWMGTSWVRAAGPDGRGRAKSKRTGLASGHTGMTQALGGQSEFFLWSLVMGRAGTDGIHLMVGVYFLPQGSLKEKQEEGGSCSQLRWQWDTPAPAGTDQAGHSLSRRPHTVWGFRKWPVPAHRLLVSAPEDTTDKIGAGPRETPRAAKKTTLQE